MVKKKVRDESIYFNLEDEGTIFLEIFRVTYNTTRCQAKILQSV